MARTMIQGRRGQIAALSVMTLVFGAMLFLGTWAIWQSGDTTFATVWAAILTPVVGILVWSIVAISREGRASGAADPLALPVVAPGSSLPGAGQTRWSFDELARGVAARLADTPYVVRADNDTIVVHADLADARWRHIATLRGLKDTFVVTLERTGSGKVRRTDETRQLDWHAGVPSIGAQATMRSGREWSYRRQVSYGLTEKGLDKPVDYTFSTGEINPPLQATLQDAGWRTELPAVAKGALAMAVMAVLPWIPIGIWLLMTQT